MAKNNKKNQHRWDRGNNASQVDERTDKLEFYGQVTEALPSTLFKVKLQEGTEILATLGGKLRMNRIRILPGDQVTVEVSPYDLSKGRITWRR